MERASKKTKRSHGAFAGAGASGRAGYRVPSGHGAPHGAYYGARGGATRSSAVQRTMFAGEKKNIDGTLPANGTLAASGAGTLTLLNGCVTGATADKRIGRRIICKSVLVRGWYGVAATTTGYGFWRHIIVVDKQSNKAAPAITEILKADNIQSPMNLGNSKRFKVLMDEVKEEAIDSDNIGGRQFSHFLKCNVPTEYADGAGAGDATDIVGGAIYSLIYWTAGTFAVAAPVITGTWRVRFIDE